MSTENLDSGLVLDAVRVTEIAAIAASTLVGRGDEKAADQAAVDAMRTALNGLAIDGEIVIGEGERDEAPMLYIGEKVGRGGAAIDIALDPLEGTTLTAKAMANALAVMAWAPKGTLLNAPDTYMDKIACGPGYPSGVIDLDRSPADNVSARILPPITPINRIIVLRHCLACIIHEDFGKSSKALARSSSSDLAEKQSVF